MLQVYVQPVPPNGSKCQVSTSRGNSPQWRPDGAEMFYKTAGAAHPRVRKFLRYVFSPEGQRDIAREKWLPAAQ